MERVGDLTVNVSEFLAMIKEEGVGFSEAALGELDKMIERMLDMFDLTAEIFMTHSQEQYNQLLEMEKRMDAREMTFRNNHFIRMQNQICASPVASSVYCDILGTIERISDHCCNIGKSTVTGMTSDLSDDEVLA